MEDPEAPAADADADHEADGPRPDDAVAAAGRWLQAVSFLRAADEETVTPAQLLMTVWSGLDVAFRQPAGLASIDARRQVWTGDLWLAVRSLVLEPLDGPILSDPVHLALQAFTVEFLDFERRLLFDAGRPGSEGPPLDCRAAGNAPVADLVATLDAELEAEGLPDWYAPADRYELVELHAEAGEHVGGLVLARRGLRWAVAVPPGTLAELRRGTGA